MSRLFSGMSQVRRAALALEVAGGDGLMWEPGDDQQAGVGASWLVRQAACIGGGTTEMARNVIAERLLGMPKRGPPRHAAPSATSPSPPAEIR